MIFYNLKPQKTIISVTGLQGAAPTLFDESGTSITYPTDNPPTYSLFPGLETKSLDYICFYVNDATTTRQHKTVRVVLGYEDLGGNTTSLSFLIPANKPVRVHIPISAINVALAAALPAPITYTEITKRYLNALNPVAGTLADIMTVYTYQQY